MRWAGGLIIGDGWGLYHGAAGDNEPHTHYAAQLICTETSTPAAVKIENTRIVSNVIFAPSNILHQIEPSDAPLYILYAEPFLLNPLREGPALINERARAITLYETLRTRPTGEKAASTSVPPVKVTDARIKAVINNIEGLLDGPIRLSEIAQQSGLSKSRFAELFRAETQLPLRQFVLWRRLRRAILAVSTGENATGAAHAAGFSDAAHFSRTVRTMFGVTPTDILSGIAITTDSPA
jgi:AraC-like DNA-binding protein